MRKRKSARAKAGTKRPRTKFLKSGEVKEAFIQAEILAWLRSTGLLHWRQNSGVMFVRGRRISLGPLGCADITVIGPRGRMVGLEVKSAKGRVSADQVAYAKALTGAGGAYFIVRSVMDAINAIAEVVGAAK